jgi:acyl-[acyl-carrier-protein]-phospholipid O-acyltransferase / long-chain-fatty-acid--[acyl-carrier-protein] ligase
MHDATELPRRSVPKDYKRGFWAHIATMFQGAFNDNLFQYAIIGYLVLIVLGETASEQEKSQIPAYATFLFSIPFIIFPGIFGAIADRFSKQRVTVAIKYLEIGIMTAGGIAFFLVAKQGLSANLLWVILFMMATQSAIFGPAKYGIMPEILPESRLSWGNGMLQMFTLVAIIAGTGIAEPMVKAFGTEIYLLSVFLVASSVVGLVTSHFITRPAPANPTQRIPINPWANMGGYMMILYRDRWLLLTVIGYVYFWAAGAFLRNNVIIFGNATLGASYTPFLIALPVGIGIGAVAAGYLSRGKIEPGLIPLGALGMGVFCILVSIPGFNYWTYVVLLGLLGAAGGIFDVPLAATLQHRSPNHAKGGIMATTNMLTFVGMATASLLFALLGNLGVSTYAMFLGTGITSLLVGAYITALLPIFLLRFVLWIFANTIYRVHVRGREFVPEKGGALLVANHSSFIDALVLVASIDRPIRFIMHRGIYDIWWIRPIAKIMGTIPIDAQAGPRDMVKSLRAATEAIEHGELACIFAEGQITRTGQMLPFRKGFERIMKGVDAPIIPVHLDQIWGSIFSFSRGRFFWKFPSKLPFPLTVSFGPPMPGDASAYELRRAVQELGTEAAIERRAALPPLHRAFVRMAKKYPRSRCVADGLAGELSYFKSFVGSVVFARKLKPLLDEQPMVGVLVPTSVGGALTNIALLLMGKIPVNLNYTASPAALTSSVRRCNITKIITSKAFLEKMPIDVPGDAIFLEDVRQSVSKGDRIRSMAMAYLLPIGVLERKLGAERPQTADDVATVIFSSGSEGDPKGVVLTHGNIMSNVDSCLQVWPHTRKDCMMGMLPFFHSFGIMGTLWLPLTRGLSAVFHPNPLEPRVIGGLIYKYKATFFVATSTFLQAFIRRCSPEELSSLTYVVCGAEKLSPRVRDAFHEKFGVEPLEGYGTTECAPAVALNVPNFRSHGFFQTGTKRGTIGHPIPGVSVRILDPETGALLPENAPGLLHVKGPNIMREYLGMPEKTAQVLQDGWYNTGDMAMVDEDGFITITGRLSRFSKLGGEMVPHATVEEELHKLINASEQVLAVAGVPDEQKGERLVVLHTMTDEQYDELIGKLDESDIPNLWRPRPNAFYRVESIPVLGTGKMDLKQVQELAKKLYLGE